MNKPAAPDDQGTSTRPYLIRALHDWCGDNGFTPYIAVHVSPAVQVPMEYVKNNEIVLNVGFEATSGLKLGNDCIEFKARFGGTPREIMVPIDHVVAIYARENGQGMAFPLPSGAPASAGSNAVPDGARGGLRLARSGGEADDGARAPTMVRAGPAPRPADVGRSAPAKAPTASSRPAPAPPPEPPEPPSAGPVPGGGRPSLKRVK